MEIKQAVILAGGQGTRLRPLTDNLPKPMIPINGKPFLEYLIEMLKDNGIEEVILLLGYLPDKIVNYFGDGSRFGVKIKYSIEDVSFDTGKRVKYGEEFYSENFLLMYCDNYWPLNLRKLAEYHENHKTLATLTIYTNKGNFTKSNVKVDENGILVLYDKERKKKDLSGVEIGFFILNKSVVTSMPNENISFQEIILDLIEKKQLAGYLTDHIYCGLSSLERISYIEKFLTPKKVIFLDRDGVVIKKAPKADYVKNWEEFEFLPGAVEAMKLLSENNYEIYIISNQAGIARGIMSKEDLEEIHKNMESELEKHKIKIKGIYYCPHGWDENCECRKPKPGMFFQASKEHGIDLSKTLFIGDDPRDLDAGNAAGIRTILVDEKRCLLDAVKELTS